MVASVMLSSSTGTPSFVDEMIRRYEREAMEERIFPLLPEGWHRELRWYTEEEFVNKTWQEGQIDPVQRHAGDIPQEPNQDCYNPMDGHIKIGRAHV